MQTCKGTEATAVGPGSGGRNPQGCLCSFGGCTSSGNPPEDCPAGRLDQLLRLSDAHLGQLPRQSRVELPIHIGMMSFACTCVCPQVAQVLALPQASGLAIASVRQPLPSPHNDWQRLRMAAHAQEHAHIHGSVRTHTHTHTLLIVDSLFPTLEM